MPLFDFAADQGLTGGVPRPPLAPLEGSALAGLHDGLDRILSPIAKAA